MFAPSILHHRSRHAARHRTVPDTFGVLSWNVYKQNTKHRWFKPFLQKLTQEQQLDFLLLQEAHFKDDNLFALPEMTFDAAANLERRGEFYGVLSASSVESTTAQAYLSQEKERFIGSHKSLLLSCYPFTDGDELMVLNIHAINFRENRFYNNELDRLFALLQHHQGPMILAGDFNTWNKKRLNMLFGMQAELSLSVVPFSKIHNIKSFMGNPLDFIFYRGLELVDFSVFPDHDLSDHHPLFAQFKRVF